MGGQLHIGRTSVERGSSVCVNAILVSFFTVAKIKVNNTYPKGRPGRTIIPIANRFTFRDNEV